ncbi:hypothetical protein [Saccharothrix deserti]|nr:hypothetical protein [Saccharothrix deserti]
MSADDTRPSWLIGVAQRAHELMNGHPLPNDPGDEDQEPVTTDDGSS